MVIVDTSVWIDAFRGTTNRETIWLKQAISIREIGLTNLTLCEVLQGVSTNSEYDEIRDDLLRFAVFNTGSAKLALTSAQHHRTLRSMGITVRKTIDCIIASFCVEYGHQLLHRDKDFDCFESHLGLQVIHP
jgi:predicted nucleic acid-binding protein